MAPPCKDVGRATLPIILFLQSPDVNCRRLNICESDRYIIGMPKRLPSPKETIKIRRLPVKGERIQLTATVTRVAEPEGHHQGFVTLHIPGAPAPITIPANYLDGDAGDA